MTTDTEAEREAVIALLEEGAQINERVLAGIDAYNERHGSHVCGPALFSLARHLGKTNQALATIRAGQHRGDGV